MKITLLFTLILLLGYSTLNAKDIKRNVNPAVEMSFREQFVNASHVTWSSGADFQKATYTIDNTTYTTFYNWDNEFIATTNMINTYELCPVVTKEIQKVYRDYSVAEIVKYDDGEVIYFVKLVKNGKQIIVRSTLRGSLFYFSS